MFALVILYCIIAFSVEIVQGRKIRTCATSADCEKDECCLNRGLIGYVPGRCKKLETRGRMCSSTEAYIGFYGQRYWKFCPCEEGLQCVINEPGRPLRNATIYNIYNHCLTEMQIRIISWMREKKVEEKNKKEAENGSKKEVSNEVINEETDRRRPAETGEKNLAPENVTKVADDD